MGQFKPVEKKAGPKDIYLANTAVIFSIDKTEKCFKAFDLHEV